MKRLNCQNNFMVRVPSNSRDLYDNKVRIINKQLLNDMKKNLDLEKIITSSLNFYENIVNKHTSEDKLNKSLLKYYIRSTTRATPYGLYAGVLQGRFSEFSKLKISSKFNKAVRPDMEWFLLVVKLCEKELGGKLRVCLNSSVIDFDTYRLKKKWNSAYFADSNSINKEIFINNTNLIRKIFELCKEYISIESILLYLDESYPHKRDSILNLINTLLDMEFLTSNLRESLNEVNQLELLLAKLRKYNIDNVLYNKLKVLKQMLSDYQNVEISKGVNVYLEIVKYMKKIQVADNYLQIDMYSKETVLLDKKVRHDIENLGNFMINCSYKNEYNEYANKFVDMYGQQAVKFIDVINQDKGIGFPKMDITPGLKYNDDFMCMIFDCINNSSDNIIQLKDLDYFNIKEESKYHHSNYEIMVNLFKDSQGNIFYAVPPILGTNHKHQLQGRFEYLYSNNEKESEQENAINVEVSFIPKYARHANVILCKQASKHRLEYGIKGELNPNTIDISDIYMYVDSDSYIWFIDRKTNKILNFSVTNMYNLDGMPEELKILYEICHNQKYSISSFYSSINHVLNKITKHCPRIMLEKTIIIPECWKIDKNIFFVNKHLVSFEEFKKLFVSYKKDNNIPDTIVVGPMDQRLTLDLNNEHHLDLLYGLIVKDNNTIFFEDLFSQYESIICDDNNGKYNNEFVFELKNNFNKMNYDFTNIPLTSFNELNKYKEIPFKKWVSVKLYCNSLYHNKVISNLLDITTDKIGKEIEYFYYIRYRDPVSHLRLRFKCEHLTNIEWIKKIADFLEGQNILYDFVIDTYHPEVNRYGGPKCIMLAEEMFSMDSYFCIHICRLLDNKAIQISKRELYFLSVNHIVQELDIPLNIVIYYLDSYRLNKEANKDYNEFLANLSDFLDEKNQLNYLKSARGIQFLTESQLRIPEYKKFWNKVLEEYKTLDNSRVKYIFISILHMHFNRLIGINRILENEMLGYIRKYLYIVYMRGKNNERRKKD